MGKKLFDFNKQLKFGNRGETDFLKFYAKLSPVKSEDRKFDFVLGDGTTVELKTDSYDMENTINFYMERYSDVSKRKLGGPWRAKQDRVRFFVYYYRENGIFFWFETDRLCKRLTKVIASRKYLPKLVRNKGWNSKGYAIPRTELVDVLMRTDKF